MQRVLMSRKEFLALPPKERLALANELLESLTLDFKPVEQRKAATDTNPSPEDLN